MEYLFSFLLFAVNLADYEIGINKMIFFAVSLVLFLPMTYFIHAKTKDTLSTCVILLCHTWPYSWVHIFGGPSYASVEITWFYLVGLFVLLYAVFNFRKIIDNKVNAVMLGVFGALCIVFIYPLLISQSISEGLKEFIMIGFFIILTLVAFIYSKTISEKNRRYIISAYIYSAAISSVFLIIQSVAYSLFGISLFKFTVGLYYGGTMLSAKLLMEDTSCSTIMIGAAIFYMLERFNRKEKRLWYVFLIVITMVGLAFTTRRTSIISLVICLILYIPIYYRGVLKKIFMMSFMAIVIGIMMFYLVIVRPVENYTQLISDNGRFDDYIASLKLFISHPLGIGYDNVYLVQFMENGLPHNTALRWLNMGGIVFTALMLTVVLYILFTAYRKGQKDDFWAIFYCVLAMNFIPDILSARFFVILCMLALLSPKKEKNIELLKKDRLMLKNERNV